MNLPSLLLLLFSYLICTNTFAITITEGKEVKAESRESKLKSANRNLNVIHQFYLGLDTYARSISKTTSVESGTKDLLSPFQFPFLFGYTYKLSSESRLMAEIDYTLFPKKGADGGTEENHLFVRLPYAQNFESSNIEWKAGIVFHQTALKGKGGTTILNNGSGTATFYLPDSTSTTNQMLGEIGINFPLRKISFQSSLFIEAPFDSKARNLSFLFGISYLIGAL